MKAPQQNLQKQLPPMQKPKQLRTGQKEARGWDSIKKCYDTDKTFFKVSLTNLSNIFQKGIEIMTGTRSFWRMGNDFLYHQEDPERENKFQTVKKMDKLLDKKVNFSFLKHSNP